MGIENQGKSPRRDVRADAITNYPTDRTQQGQVRNVHCDREIRIAGLGTPGNFEIEKVVAAYDDHSSGALQMKQFERFFSIERCSDEMHTFKQSRLFVTNLVAFRFNEQQLPFRLHLLDCLHIGNTQAAGSNNNNVPVQRF